jgi:ArsR family transcriptional regulator
MENTIEYMIFHIFNFRSNISALCFSKFFRVKACYPRLRKIMEPVQFYKCLADETRLKSLLLIEKEQELCVCELMAALEESQPKISRHLAQLRKYGLLTDKRQGQWVFYSINSELPEWAKTVLSNTTKNNPDFLANDLARLNEMGDRPARMSACCS